MKLDHVVYFTKQQPADLAAERKGDFPHTIVGGKHEKWGTANALQYMQNAYIEWLAVERPMVAEMADHPLTNLLTHDLQEKGEGFGTICLSVEGIERFREDLLNKGFDATDVLTGERTNAEGRLIRWKMLFINQPVSSELPYPFFIEWEETAKERMDALRNEGAFPPENEEYTITECIFRVQDPLRDSGEWAVLLSQKVGDHHDITLQNTILRFEKSDAKWERLADIRVESTDSERSF